MKVKQKIILFFRKHFKNYRLSERAKRKSIRKFNKLKREFIRKKRRKPNRHEVGQIIITASHHTYPVKGRNSRRWMRGKKGHRLRQNVREYLFNMKGLNYKKR